MKFRRNIDCSFLVLVSAVFASNAYADRPARSEMGIDRVSYTGSSCPSGTTTVTISESGDSFSVNFERLVIDGTHNPGLLAISGCHLEAHMIVPQGWTYGVQAMDFRGYVSLPDATVALEQSTSLNFGGGMREVSRWTILGPVVRDINYRFPQSVETVWAACHSDTPMRMDTQVRIRGAGYLTSESSDDAVILKFPLLWKRCP